MKAAEASEGKKAVHCVLRGELYKANENGDNYKLRWFELFSDGTLQWADQEGQAAKSAVSLVDAFIFSEPPVPPPDPTAKKALTYTKPSPAILPRTPQTMSREFPRWHPIAWYEGMIVPLPCQPICWPPSRPFFGAGHEPCRVRARPHAQFQCHQSR